MKIKEIRLKGIVLSSNILMAPLAGYTPYPFRKMCYKLGAGLCFTEMVSGNGLKYQDKANKKLLFTMPDEKIKAVQLLGSEPFIMRKASESEVMKDFDIIDINMGCPVPNVVKSGEGSALVGDLKRASNIISCCKKSGKIITVKCRVGLKEDKRVASEFAKMCEASGADMITIHGRSRNMMYDGKPFYEDIEKAKSAVKIPVIANGGIFTSEDAEKVINITDADGVMIARGALENPFIFSELTGNKNINMDKYDLIMDLLDTTLKYYDENYTLLYVKKIAAYFMKKLSGTKKYKQKLFEVGNIEELKTTLNLIFKGRMTDE